MDENVRAVIKELNNISRMAILENAPKTECMIRTLAKLYKYRMQEEGKQVLASTELKMVKEYVELQMLKGRRAFTFYCEENGDLLSVVIPHYAFLACMRKLVSLIPETGMGTELRFIISEEENQVVMRMVLSGKFLEGKEAGVLFPVYETKEYEHAGRALREWKNLYGEGSAAIEKEKSADQLFVILRCHE